MLLERTIWYLETHRTDPPSLRELAAAMGVTPEYLTRSFVTVTGRPVMAWLRARRLTEAARKLLSSADTVLQIALDAGFSAPEPFSRAFRAEFGLTPSALRARGHADGLSLTSAPEPHMFSGPSLVPPVVEPLPTFRVAGPLRRYTMQTRGEIPSQWADYNKAGIELAGVVPDRWYGVIANSGPDMSFDYICGMETLDTKVPNGWTVITLQSGRWARFREPGHITRMPSVWSEIFAHWMGLPELTPRDAPFLEYYPSAFDGQTGHGGFEIWMPVV